MEHYKKRKKLFIHKVERKIFRKKICKQRIGAQLKMERNSKWSANQNRAQFKMERKPKWSAVQNGAPFKMERNSKWSATQNEAQLKMKHATKFRK